MSNDSDNNFKINLSGCIRKKFKTVEFKKEFDNYSTKLTIRSVSPSKTYQKNSKLSPPPLSSSSLSERKSPHSCFYNPKAKVPSTILITNNYSQNNAATSIGLGSNNKKNSITIVTRNNTETDNTSDKMPTPSTGSTVVLDRINICINNHYNHDSRISAANMQQQQLQQKYQLKQQHQKSSMIAESISYNKIDTKEKINLSRPIEKNSEVSTSSAATAVATAAVASTTTTTTTSSSIITTATQSNEADSVMNGNSNSSILSISSSSSLSSPSLSLLSSSTLSLRENSQKDNMAPPPAIMEFSVGQDVFLQKKDGRLYLGTIIEVSKTQALVRFDDNTKCWSPFEELTKFGASSQNDDPMCVVCKKINKNDTVELCQHCGRGYHIKCAGGSYQKGTWYCRRCTAPNEFKHDNNTTTLERPIILNESQLPYNIKILSWDSYHRVNLEQIYCYCGKNGEWFNKMLQCCKCQQWFHENCVVSLNYPIFAGDEFYIFACTMCNNGKEFVRRLEMKWQDIVHLILFNLTLHDDKKYHHVEKAIIPYAVENWRKLKLQQSLRELSAKQIRENILCTLKTNIKKKFKCGREIKKNHSFWGLRIRAPPQSPKIVVPPEAVISEQYLKQNKLRIVKEKTNNYKDYLENSDADSSSTSDEEYTPNKKIKTTTSSKNNDNKKHKKSNSANSTTSKSKQRLVGKIFCKSISSLISDEVSQYGFDSIDLPSSVESTKSNNHNDNESEQDEFINVEDVCDQSDDIKSLNTFAITMDTEKSSVSTTTISAAAAVTTTTLTPATVTTSTLETTKSITSTASKTENIKYRSKRKQSMYCSSKRYSAIEAEFASDIIEITDSSDIETSSRGTLDFIVPPMKSYRGKNNPFLLKTPKKDEIVPPVTARSNKNNANKKSTKCLKNSVKTSVKRNLSDFPTQPPTNRILFGDQAASQFRLVRTVKRRLSERDIGPDNKIKRRRLRKREDNVEVISTGYVPVGKDKKDIPLALTLPMNSYSLPPSSSLQATTSSGAVTSTAKNYINSVSNIFNNRRLRKRKDKNYAENQRRNSCSSQNNSITTNNINNANINACSSSQINISSGALNSTMNSSQSDVSLSDLKTSVNMYFGGINRIKSGENYFVKARRLGPNGKYEYLIEWEGVS